MNQIAQKTPYKIFVYEKELALTSVPIELQNTVIPKEFYKERRIAEIGCSEYHSPISARSPKFSKNINGKNTLTFTLYYTYYDEREGEYKINPFIELVKNETIIKLQYGNEWYDLIVDSISKTTDKKAYNVSASDLYITELGKNGFNVQLSTELRNNMGTVQELGEYIIKNSDWRIAPQKENCSEELLENNIYSDVIIQTIAEPLYQAVLSRDIQVNRLTQYRPDRLKNKDGMENNSTISSGETVYFFYSDLLNKRKNITVLYRPDNNYKISDIDQVIQNSYNYQIKDVEWVNSTQPDLISYPTFVTKIPFLACDKDGFTKWRGERVVQSTRTGFDFKLDKAIDYYSKDDEDAEYYGYSETDYISPTLTENFLSNFSNPSSNKEDWYVSKGELTVKLQNNIYGAYVTRFETTNNTILCNYGPQGHRKNIQSLHPGDKFIVSFLYQTNNYEGTTRNKYDYANSILTNREPFSSLKDYVNFPSPEDVNIDLGKNYYNDVKAYLGFCSIPPHSQQLQYYNNPKLEGAVNSKITSITDFSNANTYTVKDSDGREKVYVYSEIEVSQDFETITDLTENLTTPLCLIFEMGGSKKIFEVQLFRKKEFIYLKQVDQTTEIVNSALPITDSRDLIPNKYYYDKKYYEEYLKDENGNIVFDKTSGQPLYKTYDQTEYYLCSNDLVYPSYVPTVSGDLLRTYFYIYKTIDGEPVLQFRGYEKELKEQGYNKIIQENCEKINSIEKKDSNYYNLISDLTKQFNCWFKPAFIRDQYNGEIEYENFYYDSQTKQRVNYNSKDYPYFKVEDGQTIKYDQSIEYSWIKIEPDTINEEYNLAIYQDQEFSIKQFSQFEFEQQFELEKIYGYKEVKDFYTDYLYVLMENGIVDNDDNSIPESRGDGIAYWVKLERKVVEKKTPCQIETIARPKKYICFCDYINADPNWAGFKYGINLKTIQRKDSSDKFSTKVIVKNNVNKYAKNGLCTIARASENMTKDNFIYNFDYYIANGMIDYADLQNDLKSLYGTLNLCNNRNEEITEEYAALKIQKDLDESNYDTYYLGAQTALQKMQDYFYKVRNCEHGNLYKTDWLDITNWELYAWQKCYCLGEQVKYYRDRLGTYIDKETSGWTSLEIQLANGYQDEIAKYSNYEILNPIKTFLANKNSNYDSSKTRSYYTTYDKKTVNKTVVNEGFVIESKTDGSATVYKYTPTYTVIYPKASVKQQIIEFLNNTDNSEFKLPIGYSLQKSSTPITTPAPLKKYLIYSNSLNYVRCVWGSHSEEFSFDSWDENSNSLKKFFEFLVDSKITLSETKKDELQKKVDSIKLNRTTYKESKTSITQGFIYQLCAEYGNDFTDGKTYDNLRYESDDLVTKIKKYLSINSSNKDFIKDLIELVRIANDAAFNETDPSGKINSKVYYTDGTDTKYPVLKMGWEKAKEFFSILLDKDLYNVPSYLPEDSSKKLTYFDLIVDQIEIANKTNDIYYQFDTKKFRDKLSTFTTWTNVDPLTHITFNYNMTNEILNSDRFYIKLYYNEDFTRPASRRHYLIRVDKKPPQNVLIKNYCEKIDEAYTKYIIFSRLYPDYRINLNKTNQLLEDLLKESNNLINQKNMAVQQFNDKYSYFIRESSWNSNNYIDDNLYYLDAVQNLSAAAIPKVSYTLNVLDISQIQQANCFKFTIGDYTYIEDTEFFGRDEYGRPIKEWVVITGHDIDLDNPKNNTLKIQNYKSSLEDLFSRLSATVYNLELTQGRYSQYSSNFNENVNLNNKTISINNGQISIENDQDGYYLIFTDKNGIQHKIEMS